MALSAARKISKKNMIAIFRRQLLPQLKKRHDISQLLNRIATFLHATKLFLETGSRIHGITHERISLNIASTSV